MNATPEGTETMSITTFRTTDTAREHGQTDASNLAEVIAALPDSIDQAAQKALGDNYSPAVATAIAAAMTAELTQPQQTPQPAGCPDGITWCIGAPDGHADPREHRHESREYTLAGRYLQDPDAGCSTANVYLSSWDADTPRLVFQGTGLWPDLDLPQADELVDDSVTWLIGLISIRRRFAVELNPGKGPFTETEQEQTASAAFALATSAMDVALGAAGDRAGMLRAMASYVDLSRDEIRS